MVKRIALSYWTAAALGAVIIAAHAWWLVRGGAGGEVMSGFGAALIVLGLFVAARPFIRAGLTVTASMQTPAPVFPGFYNGPGLIESIAAEHSARVRRIIPDVVAERIVAVAVVIFGTLLNGYGAPIARVLGLRG